MILEFSKVLVTRITRLSVSFRLYFFSVFAVSFAFSVAFSFSVLLCSNWLCFFKMVGCFSLLLFLAFPQKVVWFSCALVFAFFFFHP